MRSVLSTLLVTVLLGSSVAGQEPEPPHAADPADVASIDAIIGALYEVISGPAGPRDWDRFQSLFRDGGRLIPTGGPQGGEMTVVMWTAEEYAERARGWFAENAFYEVEAARAVEQYGHIAHVFSTYESRRDPAAEPFVRGINSIQLFNDGTRWWIVSVFWADERGAGPIPARYLPQE
jgi:hypothetical protein